MSKLYIYSTLSNDQRYATYRTAERGVPQVASSVFIAGKANVTNKHFITPRGVATEVTAEQLAELRTNEVFKLHEKNGFVTVSEKKQDAEKVAASMTGRDASAPLVEQDFAEDKAPVTNTSRRRK